MKRFVFLGTICTGLLLGAGCSQPRAYTPDGSGGESSSSGGSTGSGGSGSSSSGGSTGSGGATSTGGTSTSSGGTTATGGKVGSGGTTSTGSGGETSTGGVSASSGGAVGSGGATTTASGGATTTASGGATASGGMTGMTGSGGAMASGSGGGISPADVVPDLASGFYWEDSCQGNFDPGQHNCWTDAMSTTCPNNGFDVDKTLNVKGTAGQKYTVTIQVAGVVGTRCYMGGMAASTASIKDSDYNNWWYAGGTPYNSTGWWNTYELHVSPSTGDASKDVYYFNSASNNLASGGDCEREATYLVKYSASFKVVGGGTMVFRIHDNNCKAQQNCGSDTNGNDTCAPRMVDLSGSMPLPPSTSPAAKQPPTNPFTKTYYPQWMWITAKSVTSP